MTRLVIARRIGLAASAALFALSLPSCSDDGIFGNCSPDDARTRNPTTFTVTLLAKGGLGFHPLPEDSINTGNGCGFATCKEMDEMGGGCITWTATMDLSEGSVCEVTVALNGNTQTFQRSPTEVCDVTVAGGVSLICCDDACTSAGIYGESTCP